jgi:hypothetical protein
MRSAVSAVSLASTLALASSLAGCDGCQSKERSLSNAEMAQVLASAIAAPSASAAPDDGIGHAVNVLPGQGPKRIVFQGPRQGAPFPILPGQGVGPIRFGATKQTIERLMGVPCDDASETLCRYVGRAVEFKLEGGALKEIRLSRKGREAKRAPDGSIIEFGFFNGAFLPDLYFGMHPAAMQEGLGQPLKVEKISPPGPDGLSERHFYDGVVLEYDLWSSGNLILGAATLTKSDTAAAATEKAMAEMQKRAEEAAARAKKSKPTRIPR